MASNDGNSDKVVAAVLQMLADTRREKSMTLEQLAELSGVDHGVISRAERQQRIPSMSSIRDLAVSLDLNFADLVRKAEDQVGNSQGKES
ncbi:MAG: helix-turn-helix transcriptional regulator [Luteolibacter sp.]